MPKIILASKSERRRKLLEALGLDFEVVESGVDEAALWAASPEEFASKAAAAKAEAVFDRIDVGDQDRTRVVLAADTVVVLDSEMLGKPRDRAEALSMLRAISGRSHTVITGVVLKSRNGDWSGTESSVVNFRNMPESVLRDYVDSGAAYDKAGGYGIQELGPRYIESVEVDLSNVVGLPLGLLRDGLCELLGRDVLAGVNLRVALVQAYPGLKALPESLLSGIPACNPRRNSARNPARNPD